MAGKPKATEFSEFRHFVQKLSPKYCRIKAEWLPPMAAYILMLAKRYTKTAAGLDDAVVHKTVPGMREASVRMKWACDNLRMIAQVLHENFSYQEWMEASNEFRALLGIEPGDVPPSLYPQDEFLKLMPEMPDASDGEARGGPVRLRDSGSEVAPEGCGAGGVGGTGGSVSAGEGEVPRTGGDQSSGNAQRGKIRGRGKQRRSRAD